jgi:hypothetical protein
MVRFEIHVNGAKTCSAEVGDQGTLAALLSWLPGDAQSSHAPEIWNEDIDVDLTAPSSEQVRWLHYPMLPGDVITIRVLESQTQEPAATGAAHGFGT